MRTDGDEKLTGRRLSRWTLSSLWTISCPSRNVLTSLTTFGSALFAGKWKSLNLSDLTKWKTIINLETVALRAQKNIKPELWTHYSHHIVTLTAGELASGVFSPVPGRLFPLVILLLFQNYVLLRISLVWNIALYDNHVFYCRIEMKWPEGQITVINFKWFWGIPWLRFH